MTKYFTRVKDLDDNKIGKVVDFLSVQFTAEFEDGKVRFYFYNNKGLTYEPIDEWEGDVREDGSSVVEELEHGNSDQGWE